ncbi:hypothetical protein B0H13DRAFT_2387103 [Mycena leptocephala]|nr:hypothetical protein B0H13DRAFT_2387103 [Mycena leptocephala]
MTPIARPASSPSVRGLENALESYSRSHPNSRRSTDRTTPPWGPSMTPFDPARVPSLAPPKHTASDQLFSLSLSAQMHRAPPPPSPPSLCSADLRPTPITTQSLALSPAPAPPSHSVLNLFALRADARRLRGGWRSHSPRDPEVEERMVTLASLVFAADPVCSVLGVGAGERSA